MERREYLGWTGVTAGTCLIGAREFYSERQEKLSNPLGIPEERIERGDFWTVSAIPDTQNYVVNDEHIRFFKDQTEWIAENRDEYNIVFAVHEGDIVQNGAKEDQWGRAVEALETLRNEVPHGINVGNHDSNELNRKNSGFDNYRNIFNEQKWFQDENHIETGPDGLNHVHRFSTDYTDFLYLGLECEPRDTTIRWAKNILEGNELPVLLSTHSHLYKSDFSSGRIEELYDVDGNGNHGETLWQELIAPQTDIFMVLSGHSFGGLLPRNTGEYHQTGQNNDGEPVYEIMTDFQNRENGGNGWMKNITFLPGRKGENDRISLSTYSPAQGLNQVGVQSDFSFELNFDQRF